MVLIGSVVLICWARLQPAMLVVKPDGCAFMK